MAYTTIDDPSAYFHTRLYTGTGSSQAVTNNANAGDFQPDWVWIKCRSDAASHKIFDTSRLDGSNNPQLVLQTDATSADNDVGDSDFTSIDTNGFTVLGANATGASSRTYVAWQWKANGGTTSSNSNGSITSTVQANTTAGFSIITYTGTGSTATIGHGLNSAPEIIITKGRSDAHSWLVGVTADSSDLSSVLVLQTNAASVTATSNYNAAPNSSTYQVVNAGGTNNNADTYVAYVFHSVQGYSKIGSYTGNGNADGPFVYTGFKPAWLLIKRTDSAQNWNLHDNKRSTFNTTKADLFPNLNNAEETGNGNFIDFLSNGFKHRASTNSLNASSGDFIYMAFAEHPFVSSKGVPVTAR
jgi:hypothetical protein